MSLLEKIWAERIGKVYPRIFGDLDSRIFPLQPELFIEVFNQPKYDPKWLSFGVVCAPFNENRNTWRYISTGISDPWDDGTYVPSENEYSGMGAEWVIETQAESEWAVGLIQTVMAYHILTIEGQMGHVPAPTYGDSIRLGRSILGEKNSELQNLFIVKPQHYPHTFRIPSGHVDIFHLVGITDREYAFGEENGVEGLVEKLKEKGLLEVTDPGRESVI